MCSSYVIYLSSFGLGIFFKKNIEIYSFVYLINIYFVLLAITQYIFILLLKSPSFGHWKISKLFSVSLWEREISCVCVCVWLFTCALKVLIFFWYSWFLLFVSVCPVQSFFKLPFFFNWRIMLQAKVRVLGVFIASRINFLYAFLSDREKKNTYDCVYTHICKYFHIKYSKEKYIWLCIHTHLWMFSHEWSTFVFSVLTSAFSSRLLPHELLSSFLSWSLTPHS